MRLQLTPLWFRNTNLILCRSPDGLLVAAHLCGAARTTQQKCTADAGLPDETADQKDLRLRVRAHTSAATLASALDYRYFWGQLGSVYYLGGWLLLTGMAAKKH